jgi:tRNA(Ile)-lysidine synthase
VTGPDHSVALVRTAVRAAVADLAPDALVLVACSGGVDSVALAACAAFVGPRAGLRVGAVVIDHGLQPGSREVADRACAQLVDLGLRPVVVESVQVGRSGGPEAAARAARHAALSAVADRLGASAVLLGHTLDDQAETVLLGLARGSGARSLSGMAARSGVLRRPLLEVRRAQTRRVCEVLGLAAWEDPQNDDPRFARVRVRHEALPTLERCLGPGVAVALARSARLLRDDADALDDWAAGVARPGATPASFDGAQLDVTALVELPRAVRTRVLRMAATGVGAGPLEASHVAALEGLVTDWHGQGPVALPGGGSAGRACGRLHLSPPDPQSPEPQEHRRPRQESVRGR